MTDDKPLDGKILGGGDIKVTTVDGRIYIDADDLVKTITFVATDFAMKGLMTQNQRLLESSGVLSQFGLELLRLRDYHTAPDLFLKDN